MYAQVTNVINIYFYKDVTKKNTKIYNFILPNIVRKSTQNKTDKMTHTHTGLMIRYKTFDHKTMAFRIDTKTTDAIC